MAARATGPLIALGLLICFATLARADDLDLGLAAIDPPASIEIATGEAVATEPAQAEPTAVAAEPAAGATAIAVLDEPTLPDAPEVVVDVPPAEPVRTATAAAERAFDPITPTLAARLTDPKLPLPPRLSRKDRDALAAAYAATGHRPMWLANGAWNAAALSVLARLDRADEDGLDPAEYPAPKLDRVGSGPSLDDLAEAELKLSAAAYLYARDARGGRLEPARLSGLITPKLDIPALDAVLAALAASTDPGRVLEGYNPAYPGYLALKAKLADLRAGRPAGSLVRASGRAGLAREASAATMQDAPLRMAAPISPRLEGDVLANMERWRWLPAGIAARYIAVNVPEFRLRLMEDGRVAHDARVIAGKPATPTPIFSGLVDHAIVNPSWFVPPSILKKMVLPGLAGDPDFATKQGFQVVRRGKAISVRQPPGPRNALGYIKFMFPNDHAVYLHDTPNRNLFGAASRALSHGCVRVENPFALGGKILGASWPEARLKKMIGQGERMIRLDEKMPVHLTYFTVAIDEAGEVKTFGDLYGYHRRVRMALGLGA